MSLEFLEQAAGNDSMERRIIRVDMLSDQAGIAAALRRAFADRPLIACNDEDDMFAALLKQIH